MEPIKRGAPVGGDTADDKGRELNDRRLERLHRFLQAHVDRGAVRAVSLAVALGAQQPVVWAYGDRDGVSRVRPETRFLVASLSKPVAAAAAMRLVEDGELTLATPVSAILPAFAGSGKEEIQLLHLLTHTSGLPDMVPENVALRAAQAPLREFFDAVCRTELLFRPGTQNAYQSAGFLVLSTLIERLTGLTFAEFTRTELFEPSGMGDSSFGLADGDDGADDAQVQLPEDQQGTEYHWNSPYWRGLGAPWGGLITTASDLSRFLRLFMHPDPDVIAPATAQAMTRDALSGRGPDFAAWGLGFKIKGHAKASFASGSNAVAAAHMASRTGLSFTSPGAAHSRSFLGELTSAQAFGHAGATGCAMWVDPTTMLSCVLLTSTPGVLQDGTLARAANMVKACEPAV